MPSTNDPFHEAVIQEAQSLFVSNEWLLGDAGYEHVYSNEIKSALAKCDEVASHLIRTRADRIAVHKCSKVVWYDAKTTTWKKGSDFPIEALPFLKACCDAMSFGIDYLFCCRRRDGSDYGLLASVESAQLIQRILIPEWRRGNDTDRWRSVLQPMMDTLGCRAPMFTGGCSRGSGDAFAAISVDYCEIGTWQEKIFELTPETATHPPFDQFSI